MYNFGRIEMFFNGHWNTCVRKARWFIILFGFALAGYAGYRSSEIHGLKELEVFFP